MPPARSLRLVDEKMQTSYMLTRCRSKYYITDKCKSPQISYLFDVQSSSNRCNYLMYLVRDLGINWTSYERTLKELSYSRLFSIMVIKKDLISNLD